MALKLRAREGGVLAKAKNSSASGGLRRTRQLGIPKMSKLQKSLKKLLSLKLIEQLAIPSNLKYGRAIYKRGGVELIDHSSKEIEAWVGGLNGSVTEGGSQRRRTKLFTTPKAGLGWHCAGNPKNHQIFCKHCVALALAALDL